MLKLAEKGAACDSLVGPLLEQVDRDRERVIKQTYQLQAVEKKRKRLQAFCIGLGALAVLETVLVLILSL